MCVCVCTRACTFMKSMKRQNDMMLEGERPQVKKVSKMLLRKSGRQLLHEFEHNSGRQWRTEEPGVLQSLGLQ